MIIESILLHLFEGQNQRVFWVFPSPFLFHETKIKTMGPTLFLVLVRNGEQQVALIQSIALYVVPGQGQKMREILSHVKK